MSDVQAPGGAERRARGRALALATTAFALCFACWVINAVLVPHLVSARVFDFSESQVGWLLALPFFTGALSRVPLGILTDRYGGRRVFTALMLGVVASLGLLSLAQGFLSFALASLGVGLAGGGFAVGAGYASACFDRAGQGLALGVFGVGSAGAAVTFTLAPRALSALTQGGRSAEAWRSLPRVYAGVMLAMAAVFALCSPTRILPGGAHKTLGQRLAPLRDIVVWRFGLYYFLVFGGAVALGQWIVPYGVSAYGLTLGQAGLLATAISLPSGLIRAAGGWLSDRFGAGPVMYTVFSVCLLAGLLLGVPRMDISSPGEGVLARTAGEVQTVSPEEVTVKGTLHRVNFPRAEGIEDPGAGFLPRVHRWQVPVVLQGQRVLRRQLLAEGFTRVHYPANLRVFVGALLVFAAAAGVGMAGVYKFIPERFPDSVGVVGGMVGLIGALGGFFLPPLFSALLHATGLWTSCWWLLSLLSLLCLLWLHSVTRGIVRDEAPELVRLIERAASTPLAPMGDPSELGAATLEEVLARVSFLSALSKEERSELARLGARYSVASGVEVFRQGDASQSLYVIVRGSVGVFRESAEASPHKVATIHSGDFFGELALLDGGARSATVTSEEPSEFFVIPRDGFLNLLSRSPRLTAHLLVGLSARMRERGASEP